MAILLVVSSRSRLFVRPRQLGFARYRWARAVAQVERNVFAGVVVVVTVGVAFAVVNDVVVVAMMVVVVGGGFGAIAVVSRAMVGTGERVDEMAFVLVWHSGRSARVSRWDLHANDADIALLSPSDDR